MTTYRLEENETVVLPVGFYRDGKYYREVIIDEFRTIDQEALTSPSAKQNPVKAASLIISRVVQEIPGLMPRKSNQNARIADHWTQDMFQADRDTIILAALILAGETERTVETKCEKCGAGLELDFDLSQVDIVAHDHSQPPRVPFSLPRGLKSKDREGNAVVVKNGFMAFPTGKVMELLGKNSQKGELAMLTQQFAACSFDVEHIGQFSIEELQSLSLKDRRALMESLGESSPGPDVIRDETCHACGHEFKAQLEVARFFI